MTVQFTIQVPKTPELNQAIDRCAAKLKNLLYVFEPELVQLHGRLVRHSEREGVVCKLDLWLPTGQMAAEETGESAQAALRAANEELVRQVKKHKQKLRDVHSRRRMEPEIPVEPVTGSTSGDGARQVDLARYFGVHYKDVLAFVTRQIQVQERLGDIAPGQLDPREVLDEVVLSALSANLSQPIQRGRWLQLLAAEAMRRIGKQNSDHEHGIELQSLDANVVSTDAYALDESEAMGEQGDLRVGDLTASDTGTPEDVAYTEEVLDQLEDSLKSLPEQQRSDLVLYLLEGFSPGELASLGQRPIEAVRDSIRQAQEGLRKQPGLPRILTQRLELASRA